MTEDVESPARLKIRNGDTLEDGIQTDRFTVRQQLGRGAHGMVFLAQDNLYEREVALKFLMLGGSDEKRSLAMNEAKALAQVRHPNVVTVYEVITKGCADGQELPPFLVMEYIEGRELYEVLKLKQHRGGMDPAEAIRIMRPTAAALVSAHRSGVLHRDLKPSNIMVGEDGVVKLIDFGVAERARSHHDLMAELDHDYLTRKTNPGPDSAPHPRVTGDGGQASGLSRSDRSLDDVVGTPYYLAPELWQDREADELTEVYAFGVTLFQVLTRQFPVTPKKTVEELRVRMTSGKPQRSVRDLRPEVPVVLAEVVDRALALDPAERYQSADELLHALELAARYGARLLPDRPYVGLNAFTAQEKGVFFGREDEIARLTGRLRREQVVTLVGESGAGKSSLVLAGLGPAIEAGELDDKIDWKVARITPGADPVGALARATADFLKINSEELQARIEDDPERWHRFFDRPRGRKGRRAAGPVRGLLVVVDQLEELVTVCEDEQTRLRFGQAIKGAASTRAPLKVVLTVRSDFLPKLGTVGPLTSALEATHLVRPLDGEAMRAAVVFPARAFGYAFESDTMVDSIVADVAGRPGSLPLLQFALHKLWEQRDTHRRKIPEVALEKMGGIGAALTHAAEEVYQELSREGLREHTDRVLLDLLTPDGTKRARSLEELLAAAAGKQTWDWAAEFEPSVVTPAGQEMQVIEKLQQARLLATDQRGFSLAHEALTQNWHRLRKLVMWTRTEREMVEEVQFAAERWNSHGRLPELLLSGRSLTETFEMQLGPSIQGVEISPLVGEFLAASQSVETRSRRRRLAAIGGVLTLFLAVCGLLLFEIWQVGELEQQLEQQESDNDKLIKGTEELKRTIAKDRKEARVQARSFDILTVAISGWHLRDANNKIYACYQKHKVPGKADLSFDVSAQGQIKSLKVKGDFRGTRTGACIAGAIKSARFPQFGITLPLIYRFSLSQEGIRSQF